MKELVTEQLHALAAPLASLNVRVRQAVAGEVGKAVAEAVGEVLVATLAGPVPRPWIARPSGYNPSATGRDDWDDDADRWEGNGPYRPRARTGPQDEQPTAGDAVMPAALTLAVAAGRWWLTRKAGGWWGAAGIGVAVAGALLTGGPMARPALAALWAVHRLLAATDALKDGAQALDRA